MESKFNDESCMKITSLIFVSVAMNFLVPFLLRFVWNNIIATHFQGLPEFTYWETFLMYLAYNWAFANKGNVKDMRDYIYSKDEK